MAVDKFVLVNVPDSIENAVGVESCMSPRAASRSSANISFRRCVSSFLIRNNDRSKDETPSTPLSKTTQPHFLSGGRLATPGHELYQRILV
ncbi:hypothetical protein PISMIDRAFT_275965 [Pisolithus microcarpus 441]|uniref:Unplaced genomic scaffold scaffold_181, whole genome shotgun sequence n=1 Tax=Pisolithus microcarpus 441 TaxID=765257 RepID=A0A0C9Z8H7_9AGAM|nr:hypothetical protein PISMIDRAFT_275965 [Pisolithus microcarpus 441]